MTGRKVMWHGANGGGVKESCCAGGSCSLLIPGELKVTALQEMCLQLKDVEEREKRK